VTTKSKAPTNSQVATVLASVITVAWGVSFIVDIVVKDYDPSPSVHALMMMVSGAVFGEGLIKSRKTNDDDPSSEEGKV
jgi:hypothetical protein